MGDHRPSGNIRAFVSVSVPEPLVSALQNTQASLKVHFRGDEVRWSRPEQLHLTLAFLSAVSAGRVDELIGALGHACESVSPFRLCLAGRGCFPTARNPRVIWVGVEGELDQLKRLQRRIGEATAAFGGHTEEREFQPHLTIGRVRAVPRQARQIRDAVEKVGVDKLGEWTVKEIDLMRSELRPEGAHYSRLACFALAR